MYVIYYYIYCLHSLMISLSLLIIFYEKQTKHNITLLPAAIFIFWGFPGRGLVHLMMIKKTILALCPDLWVSANMCTTGSIGISRRQTVFFVYVMRREKLEYLVTTGMIIENCSKGKQMKDRDMWKVMIANTRGYGSWLLDWHLNYTLRAFTKFDVLLLTQVINI